AVNASAANQRDDAAGLLADALVAQSHLVEARTVLGDALPSAEASRWLWRSHGLYAAAVADWQTAVFCLRNALQGHPDDITALYRLGLCLERAGLHDEAAL